MSETISLRVGSSLYKILNDLAAARKVALSDVVRDLLSEGVTGKEISKEEIRSKVNGLANKADGVLNMIEQVIELRELKKDLEKEQGVIFTDSEVSKSLAIVKQKLELLTRELPNVQKKLKEDWGPF